MELPTCLNINPRSLYNCVNEFQTYVEEENIDVAFVSESWEKEKKPLQELIQLPNHTVIVMCTSVRELEVDQLWLLTTISTIFLPQ